jgi:hypothetical protein
MPPPGGRGGICQGKAWEVKLNLRSSNPRHIEPGSISDIEPGSIWMIETGLLCGSALNVVLQF